MRIILFIAHLAVAVIALYGAFTQSPHAGVAALFLVGATSMLKTWDYL